MSNKKKVYCKYCRFYFYKYATRFCSATKQCKSNAYEPEFDYTNINRVNNNNDCELFKHKRRWYFLWLK